MKYSFIFHFLFLSFFALPTRAQDLVDTISRGLSEAEIRELITPSGAFVGSSGDMVAPVEGASATDILIKPEIDRPLVISPSCQGVAPERGAHLPRWTTGYMYGSHEWSTSLMYGYASSSSMGVTQQLGRYWMVQGGIDLTKYSVYYNTATFNGSTTWQPTENFAITAFGAYMPGSFLSSLYLGPSFQWGGYVTLQSDSPWGIDLGARQTYDPFSGHEVLPIVKPYYKMGNAKLGIDMGPMLKSLMEKNHHHSDPARNPIPRPMNSLPPVAPRR